MLKKQNKTKILLVGASSLLGKAVLDLCPQKYQIIGTVYSTKREIISDKSFLLEKIDITNKRAVQALFLKHKFQTVIHVASIGNIDICEKHKGKAHSVNVVGTSNVADEASRQNAKMIFTSSSAVFDGKNPPYSEASSVCPVNYYGKTKVKAEKIVLKANPKNIVLRLPLMYGWNNIHQRKNIVTWILDELRSKKQVMLSSDRYTSPIFNEDVARAIFKVIENNLKGVLHIGGSEVINRFEIGKIIANIFNLDDSYIKNIRSVENGSVANRSSNEYFNITKMVSILKIKPLKIRKALIKMKKKENIRCGGDLEGFSLTALRKNWREKQKDALQTEVIKKKVGIFDIYYNPGRAKHLIDQVTQKKEFIYSPKHNPLKDVFCNPEVIKKQGIGKFRLGNYSWNILANISPVNEFNSLVVPVIPNELVNNQHLTLKFIEDMFDLSSKHRDLFIAVNSWGAGASQNHFHSHLFFSQFPITDCPVVKIDQKEDVIISQPEDYPIIVLVFSLESSFDKDISGIFNAYIQELIQNEIPYNVLFHDRKIYLAPRRQEKDEYGVKKGVDAVFGVIPVTSLDFLEEYKLENAVRTLDTIGFSNITISNKQFSRSSL